jgi:hypothetical protein
MRKGWKKGLSVLLTLVMLMSLCSTAFAAPKPKTWTIKLRVLEISDDYRLGYSFVSGSTSRNYEVDSNVNNWITVPSFETVIGELGYSVKEGYSFVGITWDQTADDQSMINIKTTDTSQQISNVYVTSNGYTVWYVVKKPVQQAPSAPGTADLSGILGNYPVKVDCTNDAAAHADALYALDPSSCTVGAVSGTSANGYTCTVTIAGAGYVAQYNQTNGAHTLSNATADVQLSWNGKAWTAAGTLPVVFNVVCAPSPTPTPTPTPTSGPDAPDDSMLPSILGDAVVTVDCTSESANHADGTYGYIAGGITVGAVAGDAQNGYTCTLTVDSSVYLAQY